MKTIDFLRYNYYSIKEESSAYCDSYNSSLIKFRQEEKCNEEIYENHGW